MLPYVFASNNNQKWPIDGFDVTYVFQKVHLLVIVVVVVQLYECTKSH